MEGAARVFAGEFSRSAISVPDPSGQGSSRVVTPSGAVCGRIFVAGAATEIADCGGGIRCRLADPTGVFTIECGSNGKAGLSESLQRIPVPSFLAIIGRAQLRTVGNTVTAFIRPESVQVISRPGRDAWILRTADSTLDRIRVIADVLDGKDPDPVIREVIGQYHTTRNDLNDLLAMVESALAGTSPSPPPTGPVQGPDAREVLASILKELQGPRGMPVEELVAQAALRGIPRERAEAGIAEMIREDDCYQPQKGSVRLL